MKMQNRRVLIHFMFLLSYLLSADVSACAVHFRFHGHYEEETKVRETNDIFMRKNREASY